MDPFEIPADLSGLNDAELAELPDAAVAAFDARSSSSTVTDDLTQLRQLADGVNQIRTEQAARVEAARAAAAEIDSLAARVRGDSDTPAAPAEAAVEDPTEAAVAAPEPPAPAPAPVAASAVPRRAPLDLSAVRSRQPRVLPEPPAPTTSITAAVDVPGYTPGAPLSFGDITTGIISRANALKTAGGGVGQVISYRHPYPQELIVTDSSSAPEGTTVALTASNQRRLPQGDLVASGGWCAPSETVYDLTDVACPDMLWAAPEIQLARGGLRYYKTPSLDVGALTWVHTEADDISGATKLALHPSHDPRPRCCAGRPGFARSAARSAARRCGFHAASLWRPSAPILRHLRKAEKRFRGAARSQLRTARRSAWCPEVSLRVPAPPRGPRVGPGPG